ncbi:unnamed protein product, partial [Timema podura]|nr:unnamed protein product [Timema podura]
MEDRAHVLETVETEVLGDCVKEETGRELQ